MSDAIKYEVGQTLWFQTSESWSRSVDVTVTKAARKWITLSNGKRVERGTRRIVSGATGSTEGTLWLDQAEHDEHVRRAELTGRLATELAQRWRGPYASAENIRQAAELLGVTL